MDIYNSRRGIRRVRTCYLVSLKKSLPDGVDPLHMIFGRFYPVPITSYQFVTHLKRLVIMAGFCVCVDFNVQFYIVVTNFSIFYYDSFACLDRYFKLCNV